MIRRPDALDAWVLAGQSNMQGRAWLRGALQPDRRVWSFSSAGQWEQAVEPLHRLWESFTPVHQALMRDGMSPADQARSDAELARREAAEGTIGAGLGISFGKAMADALRRPIGLIPAAHGGTSLGQWCESSKGTDHLYGAMLERIRRAGGRLRGVLWYQGESDTDELAAARRYGERLDRWIAALRADTGAPGLPVVVVQLGRVLPPTAGARPADRLGQRQGSPGDPSAEDSGNRRDLRGGPAADRHHTREHGRPHPPGQAPGAACPAAHGETRHCLGAARQVH